MLRQYELVDRVLAYSPEADEALINRAYVYGTKMHGMQKRANGDPYFSHPIEVAGILTELKLDAATIVTGLLHDTIEDTEATYEEIEQLFGEKIANMVDGVTKLSRLEWDNEQSKQAENFRKFILAMSNDIRVLLVKLADRLHNMRTLHFIKKEEKRQRIAQETLDIYAPLAGRMGMHEVREELEDLSFEQLHSEARATLLERLSELRAESSNVIENIAYDLRQVVAADGLNVEVYGREKKPFSIWRKMQRRSVSLEQLSDIYGFRVIVDDDAAAYAALGMLHRNWRSVPGRFKDYISTPKNNGYRSLHTTIIGPERKRVEVQIRTRIMHEVAEYGVAAHWFYKENNDVQTSDEFGNTFRWLSQLVELLEHGGTPEEFLEHTKLQLFTDQVFCFTPKGRLISLPRGATSIDFAYAVHTDIGDHCVGSKINGQHMPLRSELKNGDEVDIITSEAQQPLAAWDGIVATGKARSAIRRAVRHAQQEEFARVGKQMLKSLFEQFKKRAGPKVLERALGPLHHKTVEELLADVGQGNLAPHDVLGAVFPKLVTHAGSGDDVSARNQSGHVTVNKGGHALVALVNKAQMAAQSIEFSENLFAVPGDRLVGIVQPGGGVMLYAIESTELEKFSDDSARWIDVVWDIAPDAPSLFAGRVQVTLANQMGALGAIASLVADYEGNIGNMTMHQRDADFYDLQIEIDVRDSKHLNRILSALNGLSLVNQAYRI
ncbi:MAG: RelA/SpoT family (p)ppGpp synthetase [Parvibaculaceae bacterium]|jgi:guanosine-3',5'-bis(diphosphate) 3'-pyrophosphohydrolase|nr:bifunctional (p)ppGpp synthetase/guanosine-3',5'-bis(diphosphate) 3'-pyrophosphohydrolase [Parvibaculaceae bacterium]